MNQGNGYFHPNGMFRRVWKERAQLLGAQTSMLLQIAHPLIAAGVARHSHFSEDPLGRLNRTLDTMLSIVFGDKKEADKALARLSSVHKYVKGVLEEDAGIFKAGTEYSADDPQLKLWVHATLMHTGLIIHERFIEKLTQKEKEEFYEESKEFALLMEISKSLVPKTLSSFNDYFEEMVNSKILTVTDDGRKIANDLLNPALPLYFEPAVKVITSIALETLPQQTLEGYGLEKGSIEEITVRGLSQVTKTLLPLSPEIIRLMPQARKALISL